MSPAAWHLLILWMTHVSCPRMSTAHFPYVSQFEYVSRLHPSRNPFCQSRFPGERQTRDDSSDWSRPAIEVKAMLSPCSKVGEETREEGQDRGSIRNCSRKIVISMKFNNVGKTEIQEKFVIIDHVVNPVTAKKVRLKNPYVIKVRQEPVLQMYGLKFQSDLHASKKHVSNKKGTSSWSEKVPELRKKGCPECRQPDSLRDDKGPPAKSTKKRNKGPIGSLAIRPAMHLNEPLKNLSTGVLYGDGSPLLAGQRGGTGVAGGGNLNSVMERTSSQPDIIVESFNEKHEAEGPGYFQSKGNEGSRRLTSGLAGEGKMPSEEKVSMQRVVIKEIVENYTPQKRTLKDLSFRKSESSRRQGVNKIRRRRHFGHPHRQITGEKGLRSIQSKWRRRGRSKRSRKVEDGASLFEDTGRNVRVYLDDSRHQFHATTPSMSESMRRLAKETPETVQEPGNGNKNRYSVPGKESSSQDSVDEQIEDKFSRISDALKEAAMEPNAIPKETLQETTGKIDENFHDAPESRNTFNEPSNVSSRRRNNEATDETIEETETVLGEKAADEFNGKVPRHRVEGYDRSAGKEDVYAGPGQEERLLASHQDETSSDKNVQLADKSSTSNSQLVGPKGSSTISSSFVSEEAAGPVLAGFDRGDNVLGRETNSTTEESRSTQALIVVDVFKFATAPVEQVDIPPGEDLKFLDRPKVEGSKEAAEKPMAQAPDFWPIHRTPTVTDITTTYLTETTANATITENITTSTTVQTTLITDQTFRQSIESFKDTIKQTPSSFEFHNEVVIDETTFPDETPAPTTVFTTVVPREKLPGFEPNSANTMTTRRKSKISMGFPGRRRRRTTPSTMKRVQGLRALREGRSLHEGKGDSRPESPVQISLESGNVNLLKQKMGATNSLLHEHRNYMKLKINNHLENPQFPPETRGSRKRHRQDDSESQKEDQNRGLDLFESELDSPDSKRIGYLKWAHHPWHVTTETSEFTVEENSDHTTKVHHRPRGSPFGQGPREVTGRILLPCKKNEDRLQDYRANVCDTKVNRRGRRLLSLEGSKGVKRTSKDRKKINEDEKDFVKDGQDVDDEEEAPKGRKRMKSIHEKTQKRDASRSAQKRKKDNSRSKKQSLEQGSEDYDYGMPQQQENGDGNTFLEERQTDDDDPDEVLGNYDAGPPEDDGNEDSKISQDSQDADFDQLAEKLKIESEAQAISALQSPDEEFGKDFDISLTGKIHLVSDQNGQPLSISFNAVPGLLKKEDTLVNEKPIYNDRFPPESGSSLMDTDTLVSSGVDDANFPPGVLHLQPSLNAPLDLFRDSSSLNERFPIRPGPRIVDKYSNELENRRRRLLRLQKKSIGNGDGIPSKEETSSHGDLPAANGPYGRFDGNLKRLEEDSALSDLQRDSDLALEETEAEDVEESPDIDLGVSSNLENQLGNLAPVPSREDSKKTASEVLLDLPQVSIDLSNYPDISLANQDVDDRSNVTIGEGPGLEEKNSSQCFAMNTTVVKMDLPETTTTIGSKMAALANTDFPSYQTTYVGSNITQKTVQDQFDYSTTTARYQEVFRETTLRAKAFQFSTNVSESRDNASKDESKESIEKKDMLAVSEFVKKLEQLVDDARNSSNETGHTLIHLKKFIIVPDNRTLWTVKELVEPGKLEQLPAEDEVVLMGEEEKDSMDNKETLNVGDEMDRGTKVDNSDLIKEIISSVIRGDNLKRDVSSANSEESKSGEVEEWSDWRGQQRQKDSDGRPDREEGSNGRYTDDQTLESRLENAKESSKKVKDSCMESKLGSKEKREAPKRNANLKNHRDGNANSGKRKAPRHAKKMGWRKGKRKMKKRKWGNRKKSKKKSKSAWPFKRNLLMLAEKQQVPASSERYDAERKINDKHSPYEGTRKKMRSRKNSEREEPKEPQIRGGQDCADRRHSQNEELVGYLESAHCLRFSDLWYSVYQLEDPVIDHTVHLQIYEKLTSSDGSVSWKDLTKGSSIRLGTSDRHYRNEEDTMALEYSHVRFRPDDEYNLDPRKDRLLVPSTLTGERYKYPEDEGWSGEYLVVQADEINENANECDKAGVGFTAFVGQPDRCERVRGTCLKNQPLAYWRHDTEARATGRAGCYFLSNFAWVPSEAIKYNVNGTGSREFLALEYHSPHVSVIDVELRADNNALLRAGSSGQLSEVHADNRAIDYTVITAVITNKGSSLSFYRARITDCPRGLPVSWLNAETPTKIIPPRSDREITLDLDGRLPLNEFSCSVELVNRDGEPVARRQIKVRKTDRCSCVRHCACSCVANAQGTACEPISLENYHAAGFRGTVPKSEVHSFIWWSPVAILCLVWTALLLTMLLMGISKWLIGLCVPAIGRWGLDAILAADKMRKYYEKDLKSRSVVFDQFGAPIHPDTGRKTVRICNRTLEFFLNVIFFFVYPFASFHGRCSKPQRPNTTVSSVESKSSLGKEETFRSRRSSLQALVIKEKSDQSEKQSQS
ncbi:uncharacterized protein LOC128880043 isoform X2 [Hylaeus volcanicus]|uniref:uncharacterized protein LOC128880043 isoform X2 n=1 Tax=Hylaeus volcanicus TaxID=313075 RepID=UPI0023B7C07B|nr:uncharacterized protein LOC128880043 isoform X2 [Hylaeus volcanicus]